MDVTAWLPLSRSLVIARDLFYIFWVPHSYVEKLASKSILNSDFLNSEFDFTLFKPNMQQVLQ